MCLRKKYITCVHPETKQWHGHALRSVSTSLFQSKQLRLLSLGLGLSFVWETGGQYDKIVYLKQKCILKLDKKTKVQDCVLNGFSEGEKVQY